MRSSPGILKSAIAAATKTLQSIADLDRPLAKAAEMVEQCLRGGNKLLVCGNGGSASDAAHFATELVEPGVIHHTEGNRLSLGEPDGTRSDRCKAISEALIKAGIRCPVTQKIRTEIWVKILGNVAFNPLSALTRATMVEMCQHRHTRQLAIQLMEEALDIAARLGSTPDISIDKRLRGAENVGHHKTSMLQDLEAGKQLELDAIVTAVVELADLTGAPAPTLRTIHAATDLLARSCPPGASHSAGAPQSEPQPALSGFTTARPVG